MPEHASETSAGLVGSAKTHEVSDPFHPGPGRLRCCFGSDHFLLKASPPPSVILQMEHPKSSLFASLTQPMEGNFRGAIEPHGNDG